jgi:hypothetical protein
MRVTTIFGTCQLTTEHAMSSHGIPVLILPGGSILGPDSPLPPHSHRLHNASELEIRRAEYGNEPGTTPFDIVTMPASPAELTLSAEFDSLIARWKGGPR